MTKNRSHPSSSTSCDGQVSPSEEVGRPVKRLWREKLDEREKDTSKQRYLTRDFPVMDKSWHPKTIPGPDGGQSGSLCRKRRLECDSLLQAKRVKKDYKDYPRDLHSESPSLVRPHPSSHSVRMRNNRSSSSCVSFPDGRRCIVSHPCSELHPYQTPSREPNRSSGLGFCFVRQAPKGYLCNSFSAFHTAPPYFPFGPRQQETVDHRPTQSLPLGLSPLQMAASSSWPSANILSGTGEFLQSA
ncbi:unnamed protein product [Menidia menidia]|uniref:(Atlantic silverside) hypothetical protein n=1 Tax=Menidia menidia TaxID=238744 RepID=A0A8S4BKP5_9TELE|nr:unnamed protein product [Menidia menidia]